MARSVVSYGSTRDGNAHTLLSGIEPTPRAALPARVRTRHSTFNSVTRSSATPPNLIGVR